MRQEQIHDALTELPEALLASTAQARTKKRVVWGPWVALAACACLVLVLGTQVAPMFRAGNAAPENAGVDFKSDAADYYYGYSDESSLTEASVLLVKVQEVYGSRILVTPLEGETLTSDSCIILAVEDGSGYAVGDILRIEYDGRVLETYPLQLGRVYSIERLGTEQ